ncbi:diguanylate cyclase (GGDEF) domain-containing protein [Clostridium collagenovorans DSM 3089]|uniref:Diguanylate cyclase (GGDEF) domain-containing protein n=1 Tax=Clostridium collagenovorans DSM 3089 TaxID=1121306 RepID=A0A1M5U8G5_9CLOT|nr:tetratricopeptide repeat-containing diguanylate cyclase [Clostridium collagenovorans]SHH59355.1 diguanylate cyclase (GGDEF) domain-containing protein [Clostridium collagenovorans DSM 3089]
MKVNNVSFSKNIFKRKKSIWIIFGFVIVIGFSSILSGDISLKESMKLNRLIDFIEENKELKLSSKEISELNNKLQEIINKTNNNKTKVKAYFIIGYYENIIGEYTSSNENIKISLDFNKEDSTYLKGISIMSHNEMSKNYFELGRYEESSESFKKAIELGDDHKYNNLIANMYISRANILQNQEGKIGIAIEILNRAKALKPSKEILANIYLKLSKYYLLDNKLDLALEYNIKSLKIARKGRMKALEADALIELGSTFSYSDDYEKSISILNNALMLEEVNSSRQRKINTLAYLSDSYCGNGEYNKSLEIVEELLNEIENLDEYERPKEYVWAYTMAAGNLNLINKPKEAIKYLDKAKAEYNKGSKEKLYLDAEVYITSGYGDCWYNMGEYDKALEAYKETVDTLKERNRASSGLSTSLTKLRQTYGVLNEYEKAYKVEEEREEVEGEIRNKNIKQSLIYVSEKIKAEENEEDINRLKFQRTIVALIIIALIVVLRLKSTEYRRELKLKEEYNKKLKELALRDSLTGVWNRRKLHEVIKDLQELDKERKVTFIMIDIDFFKLYNDNYGHLEGDKVLLQVAETLHKVFENDVVGRYGGEEFYILLDNYDGEYIEHKLKNLINKIKELDIEHKKSQVKDRVSISIGASIGKIYDIDNVILKADKNLYEVKENGRDNYKITD